MRGRELPPKVHLALHSAEEHEASEVQIAGIPSGPAQFTHPGELREHNEF